MSVQNFRFVAPGFRPTVLQPENHRRRIGRDMLPNRRADNLTLMLEYLLGFVGVASSLVVQAPLNAIVRRFLACL